MLRWSNTQIKAGVFPGGVVLIKVRGSRNPVIVDQRWLPCQKEAVTRTLGDGLKDLGARGQQCTIILSNEYARYLVIQRHKTLVSPKEWSAYVDHQYEMAHGPRVSAWRKNWSTAKGQKWVFTSAADDVLLGEIEQQCNEVGCKLQRMVPLFVAAHNVWQPGRGEQRALFVVIEPSRLCVVAIDAGSEIRVRTARWGGKGDIVTLTRIIEQERLILGQEWWQAPVYCCGIGYPPVTAEQTKGMGIQVLQKPVIGLDNEGDGRDYAALAWF